MTEAKVLEVEIPVHNERVKRRVIKNAVARDPLRLQVEGG